MKRSGFKNKQRKPLKRKFFLTKKTKALLKEIKEIIIKNNTLINGRRPPGYYQPYMSKEFIEEDKRFIRNAIKKSKTGLRRTKLRKVGQSATSKLKTQIQSLLRQIAIHRDGGCILRNTMVHKADSQVLQAEHLITRANNATYADERLVVCICKSCHNWKHLSKENKDTYDSMIRSIVSPSVCSLWTLSESQKHLVCRKGEYEWKQDVTRLKKVLQTFKN